MRPVAFMLIPIPFIRPICRIWPDFISIYTSITPIISPGKFISCPKCPKCHEFVCPAAFHSIYSPDLPNLTLHNSPWNNFPAPTFPAEFSCPVHLTTPDAPEWLNPLKNQTFHKNSCYQQQKPELFFLLLKNKTTTATYLISNKFADLKLCMYESLSVLINMHATTPLSTCISLSLFLRSWDETQ